MKIKSITPIIRPLSPKTKVRPTPGVVIAILLLAAPAHAQSSGAGWASGTASGSGLSSADLATWSTLTTSASQQNGINSTVTNSTFQGSSGGSTGPTPTPGASIDLTGNFPGGKSALLKFLAKIQTKINKTLSATPRELSTQSISDLQKLSDILTNPANKVYVYSGPAGTTFPGVSSNIPKGSGGRALAVVDLGPGKYGIIVDSDAIDSNSDDSNLQTLTHEMLHWLGVRHYTGVFDSPTVLAIALFPDSKRMQKMAMDMAKTERTSLIPYAAPFPGYLAKFIAMLMARANRYVAYRNMDSYLKNLSGFPTTSNASEIGLAITELANKGEFAAKTFETIRLKLVPGATPAIVMTTQISNSAALDAIAVSIGNAVAKVLSSPAPTLSEFQIICNNLIAAIQSYVNDPNVDKTTLPDNKTQLINLILSFEIRVLQLTNPDAFDDLWMNVLAAVGTP